MTLHEFKFESEVKDPTVQECETEATPPLYWLRPCLLCIGWGHAFSVLAEAMPPLYWLTRSFACSCFNLPHLFFQPLPVLYSGGLLLFIVTIFAKLVCLCVLVFLFGRVCLAFYSWHVRKFWKWWGGWCPRLRAQASRVKNCRGPGPNSGKVRSFTS